MEEKEKQISLLFIFLFFQRSSVLYCAAKTPPGACVLAFLGAPGASPCPSPKMESRFQTTESMQPQSMSAVEPQS